MSSHFTCCGCWPTFIRSVQGTARPGRKYRRAKYNEREYSIEFENLIEEEDFYPPSQHVVTEVEKDLLARGKYGELMKHEADIAFQQDTKLKEKEENARLEDEAYIQAKREASRVAKQTLKKKVNGKPDFPNMKTFDSVEFSKWLSEEKIDITSPELDVEDFESFLEKVRAKSAQALEEAGKKKDATAFEQTLTQGLAATKIAGDALNALQPVELHAVGMPLFNEKLNSLMPTNKMKSDNTIIPLPQLPYSPGTNVEVVSGIPAIQSSAVQSSDLQSTSNISATDMTSIPDNSQSVDTSKMFDVSATSKTITSEISHALNFNNSHEVVVKNSLDATIPNTLHFSLDNSSQACVTNMSNEKLIDVSPLNDDSQLLAVKLQSEVPQDHQFPVSFDEPSIPNMNGVVNPIGLTNGNMEQPTAKPTEAVKTIPDMQTENESSNMDALVPMTTVVTINTPRNMATNLNPIVHSSTITNEADIQSDKMATPSVNQDNVKDSLSNSDDDFYDFDDDFANSNHNGAFEDYLA